MFPPVEHPTLTVVLCVGTVLVFQPSAPAPIENRFDVVWAALPEAKKTDQMRVIPLTVPPKTVVTERIVMGPPSPVDDPPVSAAPLVSDKPVARRELPKQTGDICTRHRMRKMMIDKYRWRCVR
jgi:hypothetical protein